jgi:hypothetical protein
MYLLIIVITQILDFERSRENKKFMTFTILSYLAFFMNDEMAKVTKISMFQTFAGL